MCIRIETENDETLRSKKFIGALARKIDKYGLTRMGGFIFLMGTTLDHRDDGGMIFDGNGDQISVHDDVVEEAYNWELSFSWHTDIKVFATRMPKRRAKVALVPRIRLWDATFKIIGDPIVVD